MIEHREQAIKDVAEAIGDDEPFVEVYASTPNDDDDYGKAVSYAVSRQERVLELEAAIRWALGYGDFRERHVGEGAYWWRKELRERAALAAPEREKTK